MLKSLVKGSNIFWKTVPSITKLSFKRNVDMLFINPSSNIRSYICQRLELTLVSYTNIIELIHYPNLNGQEYVVNVFY